MPRICEKLYKREVEAIKDNRGRRRTAGGGGRSLSPTEVSECYHVSVGNNIRGVALAVGTSARAAAASTFIRVRLCPIACLATGRGPVGSLHEARQESRPRRP
ncbi:hypothetical protein EVAR_63592_1 [Eumeta japonica]|uniref:Uncharacterized protein n=1 Tax=Eumeta variegata TaxID=151549 RepID=A0A4C1ZHJ7_EUMVA|nr:hypothetical protein EVAR_63592_1 [Eumeta japonica]